MQHIRYLSAASEIGQEMVFPGQGEVLAQAATLQTQLDTIPLGDISQLTTLATLSKQTIE